MALGANQEYVVDGGLPEAPSPSRLSNGEGAAATPRPEVIHLRLSSQIIEQISQQLEDAEDDQGKLNIELDGNSMAFHIGTRTFPLSKSSEYSSTPHDLFRVVGSSTRAEMPTALLPVGPVSYQLSARAGSGPADLAAERLRLKEWRDEEDARRTHNSAVLLEPGQIGGKKGKKTDRHKSGSSVALTSTSKRNNPPASSEARQHPFVLVKSSSGISPPTNATSSEQPQTDPEGFSVTNPSLRTRLIQQLATGPIAQEAILAQLGSAATSLLPSVASQDSQQRWILKDELCVEVRIAEWPGYTDAKVRSAVSDRVNLGLRKKRVGRSHEAWARLWPDGKIQRPPPEASADAEQKAAGQQAKVEETIPAAAGAAAALESAYDSSTSVSVRPSKKTKPTTLQRVAKAAKGKKFASAPSSSPKTAAQKSATNAASMSKKSSASSRAATKAEEDLDIPIRKKARTTEGSVPTTSSPLSKRAISLSKQRARSPDLERIPRRAEADLVGTSTALSAATAPSILAQRKKQSIEKTKAAAEAERKRLERARDYTDSSEEEAQGGREKGGHGDHSHRRRSPEMRRGFSAGSHNKRSRSSSLSPPRGRHDESRHSESYSYSSRRATESHAHRGVGPGAHAHSEPWLDVRTTADFTRLAERFKRDYAEYASGRDRVRKEGEWLEAERKVVELEEEEERVRVEREREARDAAAAAIAAPGAGGTTAADDSPEEGETSPILERDLERGMVLPSGAGGYPASVSEGSRGFGGPPTSVSTNPTTRSPSPVAIWREGNGVVEKELATAAGAGGSSEGGPTAALPPPPLPSTGPMAFGELEKLVRRIHDLHGQLWRMKAALVEFKRRAGGMGREREREREWDRDRERERERDRSDRDRSERDWRERSRDRQRS